MNEAPTLVLCTKHEVRLTRRIYPSGEYRVMAMGESLPTSDRYGDLIISHAAGYMIRANKQWRAWYDRTITRTVIRSMIK